jgi:hypothetical protein
VLSCEAFQPFDVLQFPYEFDGDPQRILKLWVVALNVPAAETLICFKPTATTSRYDREETLVAGVVEYKPGEVTVFAERTLIDPIDYRIPYSHLRSCYINERLTVVGQLPEDFRDRITIAANKKVEWRKRNRDYFFNWFNSSME